MVRFIKFFRGVLPVSAGVTLLFFATTRAHGKNFNCANCGTVTRQKSPLSETSLKLAQTVTNLLNWSIAAPSSYYGGSASLGSTTGNPIQSHPSFHSGRSAVAPMSGIRNLRPGVYGSGSSAALALLPQPEIDYSFANSGPAPVYRPVHLMQFPKPVAAQDIVLPNSLETAGNSPAWYNQTLGGKLSQLDPSFQTPFWNPDQGLVEHPSAPWHYDWETAPNMWTTPTQFRWENAPAHLSPPVRHRVGPQQYR